MAVKTLHLKQRVIENSSDVMNFQKYKSVLKNYYLDSKIMQKTSKLDEVDGEILTMFHKKVKLLSVMRSSIEMCSSCEFSEDSLSHSFTSSNTFKSFKESEESPLEMIESPPLKTSSFLGKFSSMNKPDDSASKNKRTFKEKSMEI